MVIFYFVEEKIMMVSKMVNVKRSKVNLLSVIWSGVFLRLRMF